MADAPLAGEDLTAGRAALASGAWPEARERFLDALADHQTPEALEGLSWASWWLEDVEGCLDARRGAYRRYRERGAQRDAARMALWLGDDHLEFHGERAVARGWFARAARLLAGLEPGPEHGWLAVFEAHDALHHGALDTAGSQARRARDVGRQHGSVALEMFALSTVGVIRIERGEVDDGMACLDEAAAAALAGEFEDLAPAAWSCCLVLSACERARHYERAAQWCRQIERFGRRTHARFLRGVCRAHYGTILAWHGSWERADQELVEALDELTTTRPSWRSEAAVRLGQLRRQQGRLDAAEHLFEQAPNHPLALHGMAATELERGDAATARDLLHRALRQHGATGRIDVLELLVRTALAVDDLDEARRWLHELRTTVDGTTTEASLATLRACEGRYAEAEAEHERARDRFEDAIDLFLASDAPVEAARIRLELAATLLELDRTDAAREELRRAGHGLAGVDAGPERARADALLERSTTGHEDPVSGRDRRLTDRQVEVLRLIAEGLTDQEVASRLVLSPHTVHRHVANIYTRLGCSTRPAAVAEAGRRGLL